MFVRYCMRLDSFKRKAFSFNRILSTVSARHLLSFVQSKGIITRTDENQDMRVWSEIVKNLSKSVDVPDVSERFVKVLDYNVPKGKGNRYFSLINAYKKLVPSDQLTEENLRLARILGWSIEILLTATFILDDVQDNSKMRRGQQCWHCVDGVGLASIKDAILLEKSTLELIRIYFEDKPCYIHLIDTFHRILFKASMGQILDSVGWKLEGEPKLNTFTMDTYTSIVKYKTAYPAFVFPIQFAIHLANIKDPKIHKKMERILLKMGHFYQVQDDYIDCFGNPKVTGKVGTDIQEGKCSWLVVKALELVTPEQRKILEECYGVSDPEKIVKVKQLYSNLKLQKLFSIYEEETYKCLKKQIQRISDLPHEIFFDYLEKIYKRKS